MRKFHRVEIIEALAGSGKTQELTYRFLRLMAMGFDPKTILATTFSKKAAGEIRDRIIELLAMAMLDSSAMQVLTDGVPEISQKPQECESLLRQLVASLHRLNIGTIDSFFVKTAYAFSEALEMTPRWSILDEVNASEVFSDAVSRLTSDPSNTKQLALLLRQSMNASKVPIQNTLASLQGAAFYSVRDSSSEAWIWGKPYPTMTQEALDNAIDNLSNVEPESARQRSDIPKAVAKLKRGKWGNFLESGMAKGVVDESFLYYRKELEPVVVAALQPIVDHCLGVMANGILSKNKSTYELMMSLHACWINSKHDRGLYSFDDVTYRLSLMTLMKNLVELQFRLDSSIDHRSEEHTSELQSRRNLVCRLLLEKKKKKQNKTIKI